MDRLGFCETFLSVLEPPLLGLGILSATGCETLQEDPKHFSNYFQHDSKLSQGLLVSYNTIDITCLPLMNETAPNHPSGISSGADEISSKPLRDLRLYPVESLSSLKSSMVFCPLSYKSFCVMATAKNYASTILLHWSQK